MAETGKIRKKRSKFAQVSNHALQNKNLSLKAKGLFALIQSLIDIPDFTLYKTALMNTYCSEGRDAFNKVWNELKDNGYLKVIQVPGSHGHFQYEYELLDVPEKDDDSKKNESENLGKGSSPCTENPYTVEPTTVNPAANNTKANNTDENNTKNQESSNIKNTISSLEDGEGRNESKAIKAVKGTLDEDDVSLIEYEGRMFTSEQWKDIRELVKMAVSGQISATKSSVLRYIYRLQDNGWLDSKGEKIKSLKGYVVSNFDIRSKSSAKSNRAMLENAKDERPGEELPVYDDSANPVLTEEQLKQLKEIMKRRGENL